MPRCANKVGDKKLPFGIPYSCLKVSDSVEPILILKDLSDQKPDIKFCNQPLRPILCKSRKENPQKLTQLSSRSHPRQLVGKRTAQKDITIDTASDSQVNSNFPNKWSPASLIFNNYFYLFLYLHIT